MSTAPVMDQPNPVRFFDAIAGYQVSFVLKTAIELDVFTAVSEGARTTAALSTRLNASERGVRILCDVLTTHGFLAKAQDQSYSLTPDSAMFLDRNSRAFIGGVATFLMEPEMVSGFQNLTAAVRT